MGNMTARARADFQRPGHGLIGQYPPGIGMIELFNRPVFVWKNLVPMPIKIVADFLLLGGQWRQDLWPDETPECQTGFALPGLEHHEFPRLAAIARHCPSTIWSGAPPINTGTIAAFPQRASFLTATVAVLE